MTDIWFYLLAFVATLFINIIFWKIGLFELAAFRPVRGCLQVTWNYVAHTNNPLVQIFYLAVIGGGYAAFYLASDDHIPNERVPYWHRWSAAASIFSCLLLFYLCSVSDPGTITKHNEKLMEQVYEYDGVVFVPGKKCTTCHTLKAARSKHCRLCDRCVARFDHHCIWIANCVGARNCGLFLMFLLCNAAMCTYGFYLIYSIMMNIILGQRLFYATFLDASTGIRQKASWKMVMLYLFSRYTILICLGVLCAVFSVFLFLFFCWHVYLAAFRNMTTNEMFKLADLEYIEDKPTVLHFSKGLKENVREIFLWKGWIRSRNKTHDELHQVVHTRKKHKRS